MALLSILCPTSSIFISPREDIENDASFEMLVIIFPKYLGTNGEIFLHSKFCLFYFYFYLNIFLYNIVSCTVGSWEEHTTKWILVSHPLRFQSGEYYFNVYWFEILGVVTIETFAYNKVMILLNFHHDLDARFFVDRNGVVKVLIIITFHSILEHCMIEIG